MRIFSRRTADRPEPMDEALTFLTVSEADRIRALLHHAFGEHGLEVTTHADHAVDAVGLGEDLGHPAAEIPGDAGDEYDGHGHTLRGRPRVTTCREALEGQARTLGAVRRDAPMSTGRTV